MPTLLFPVQEDFKTILRLVLQKYVLLKRKSSITGIPKALVISIIMLPNLFHHLQTTLTAPLQTLL